MLCRCLESMGGISANSNVLIEIEKIESKIIKSLAIRVLQDFDFYLLYRAMYFILFVFLPALQRILGITPFEDGLFVHPFGQMI
ncbi:MAG: hypothetical protein IJ681_07370 [Bacteroidales bacterium]|nr:hypothetical protein [Bacteroidales bacterium]